MNKQEVINQFFKNIKNNSISLSLCFGIRCINCFLFNSKYKNNLVGICTFKKFKKEEAIKYILSKNLLFKIKLLEKYL